MPKSVFFHEASNISREMCSVYKSHKAITISGGEYMLVFPNTHVFK